MVARDKITIDVNTLAIFLVEDHPGNRYVAPQLEEGLQGRFIPLTPDIVPIRAYWITPRQWGCDREESEKAIRHFLDHYPTVQYCRITREVVHVAFELARELHHDGFDTAYLAVALQNQATGIMTTDTDFRKLCQKKHLQYLNPVPTRVLEKFVAWKTA